MFSRCLTNILQDLKWGHVRRPEEIAYTSLLVLIDQDEDIGIYLGDIYKMFLRFSFATWVAENYESS